MKNIALFTIILGLPACENLYAQTGVEAVPGNWTVFNREVDYKGEVIHLDARQNDGVLWLNRADFKNGSIELDIKGRNVPGQSFVGLAFHAQDDSTFDAVYFRPFNFKNPERKPYSIQYISMPGNDWAALRKTYPGKYENEISPVPDPDDWFHVKIVVNHPQVKVYINDSEKPSAEIGQINTAKQGKIGLWVGNGSEGWFKNLKIQHGK